MVKKDQEKNKTGDAAIKEMADLGMHLGHQTSRLHPKMSKFILGIKNTIHIIDLEKTNDYLEEALKAAAKIKEENGEIIFVSTKPPLRKIVKETAEKCRMPYVIERWIGGTFTNFEVLQKRINYFKDLEAKKESGELEKYTKKEQLKIEDQIKNLKSKFEGIKNMEKLPQAVFICDINKDNLCFQEAKKAGVKVIAIVDTNTDPTQVDYPIPANDDSLPSVSYILKRIEKTILETKSKNSNAELNQEK